MSRGIAKVAVPAPFPEALDYLFPRGAEGSVRPAVGARVRVPLGNRRVVGVVTGHADASNLADSRLRRIVEVLDEVPLIPEGLLGFIAWAARYYHYPPGEALAAVLPPALRQGKPNHVLPPRCYRLRDESQFLPQSRGQIALIERLRRAGSAGIPVASLEPADRRRLQRLVAREAIEPVSSGSLSRSATTVELNEEQRSAVESLRRALPNYTPMLLDGVTGSGKTEVYIEAMREVLQCGGQVLVLVPEISLTPQLLSRLEAGLGMSLAAYHSGLPAGERLRVWREAAAGTARVVVGTRSAVFLPLARPGLFVVDEEHDPSFKQQDGFRYHARDLAVYRARVENVPVVLGSATPSLESLANVARGRYHRLHLGTRATGASPPRLRVVDLRRKRLTAGLSGELLQATRQHLTAGGQVLFFLNRRGYAPVVLCHACGTPIECRRCSVRLTWHRERGRLVCHHCGAERAVPEVCPSCGEPELVPIGKGTEQLEAVLTEQFPGFGLARIDRDSTRRRGRLAELLETAASGAAPILVGTQMLAKGHDFANLTLVAVVNADQGLYGTDFRAAERTAQLIVQVAGRAGRRETPGEVLIQTRWPEHPLLVELFRRGYAGFAETALDERKAARLPPYGAQTLIRAEAGREVLPREFLQAAAAVFANRPGVHCLGPAPAPILRRAGRYRYQLLLESSRRAVLQRALDQAYAQVLALPEARRVRVSLDVDPMEMS